MKRFDIGTNCMILGLFGLLLALTWIKGQNAEKTAKECEIKVVYVPDTYKTFAMLEEYGNEEPTQEMVLYVMTELGIEHIHIAYAQMVLESGHFSSKLAKENNNYFGMKEPSVRDTVSLGKKNGYASYKNWAWSVFDYALWQRHLAQSMDETQYLEFLGRVYAEDEKYVNKVKNISKSLI